MLLLEKPVNFKSMEEYSNELKNFKSVKDLKIGYFYSYFYDYKTDVDFDILKYYDFSPLVLIFNKSGDSSHYFGINFHHIPLLTRNLLLSRIKNSQPQSFKSNKLTKVKISYGMLKTFLRKSPLAVRQYIFTSAHDIRIITNDEVQNLCKYAPPTFHAVDFPQVVKKYSSNRSI